jgi:hypothetical protein
VALWNTGFLGARLGLPHAGALTVLALRFGLAAGLLGRGLGAGAHLLRLAATAPVL